MMEDFMYKVGVVGFGVVGQGIVRLFRETVTAIFDPNVTEKSLTNWLKKEKITDIGVVLNEEHSFVDCDMVVICVPTPTSGDGMSCDTSIVESTVSWLVTIGYRGVVLIKSAVVPQEIIRLKSTYSLRFVVSPEYMGESKYFTPFWKYPDPSDMRSHQWQIYGGDKKDTSLVVDIFKRRMSVDTIHLQTDIVTAALTKYMENSFFALKVTFCNEWYDIAKAFGVDYNELRECWLADTRINRNHTLVFPKDRGYGGKCFPKDVKAIIKDSQNQGYTPKLMVAVNNVNEEMRKKNG